MTAQFYNEAQEMFEEKSQEWYEERGEENPREREFSKVYFAEGDVEISHEAFHGFLFGGDIAIVIDGNLKVDGTISISDFCALVVSGDVHCKTFWACDDGYFECENLVVEKYAECDIQGFDTFDVSKIHVPILYAPYCDVDNISYNREVEFLLECDEDDEEFDPRMEKLSEHFDEVYTLLKARS